MALLLLGVGSTPALAQEPDPTGSPDEPTTNEASAPACDSEEFDDPNATTPCPTYDTFGEQPPLEPLNESATGAVVNRLTVEAATGRVLSWEDLGSDLTDVAVVGVAGNESGFDLVDPSGRAVFANQSSTYAGAVEFWSIRLEVGIYTVIQAPGPGAPDADNASEPQNETTVTSFSTVGLDDLRGLLPPSVPAWALPGVVTKLLHRFVAWSIGPHAGKPVLHATHDQCAYRWGGGPGCGGGGSSGGSGGSGGCSTSYYDVSRGTATLWTPVLTVNAPYGGSTTASSGWNTGKSVIVSWGKTSVSEIGVKLNGVNGESRGQFQIAKWGAYDSYYYSCGGPYYLGSYTRVIDWRPLGNKEQKTIYFYGGYRQTDADDQTIVGGYAANGNWYSGVQFDTRYRVRDHTQSTSGGPVTHLAKRQTFTVIGGGASVGGAYFSFDVVRFQSTTSNWAYFEYYYPANALIYSDYLGSSTDSSYARAFCRPTGVSCA